MFTTQIFETAVNECGYHLHRLFYSGKSRYVRKAEGFLRIRRKRVIDGKVKRDKYKIRVRWDAQGCCFLTKNNNRMQKYDLPLQTVCHSIERKEYESCM